MPTRDSMYDSLFSEFTKSASFNQEDARRELEEQNFSNEELEALASELGAISSSVTNPQDLQQLSEIMPVFKQALPARETNPEPNDYEHGQLDTELAIQREKDTFAHEEDTRTEKQASSEASELDEKIATVLEVLEELDATIPHTDKSFSKLASYATSKIEESEFLASIVPLMKLAYNVAETEEQYDALMSNLIQKAASLCYQTKDPMEKVASSMLESFASSLDEETMQKIADIPDDTAVEQMALELGAKQGLNGAGLYDFCARFKVKVRDEAAKTGLTLVAAAQRVASGADTAGESGYNQQMAPSPAMAGKMTPPPINSNVTDRPDEAITEEKKEASDTFLTFVKHAMRSGR